MTTKKAVKNIAKGLTLGISWPAAVGYVAGRRVGKFLVELSHDSLDTAREWIDSAEQGLVAKMPVKKREDEGTTCKIGWRGGRFRRQRDWDDVLSGLVGRKAFPLGIPGHGNVGVLRWHDYPSISACGTRGYGGDHQSSGVEVDPDGDGMTQFDGKVIGRVTMKFNGVVVAESIQATAQAVDEETDKFMIALELALTKNT